MPNAVEELRKFLDKDAEKAASQIFIIMTIAFVLFGGAVATIQYSLPDSQTTMGSVVTLLWFLAVVASAFSGITCLLAMISPGSSK